ncbi:MAG: 2-dehydropantoate 2-reductase N-terminal domain-containing protein [Bacteroidales bacterium]|nr:NAD(P)-binding domain-containing protein [Lentimicrobiaceae bacterium]MDD5695268.1 2-dehydropantoate 2-reductase N-terminal domain-containing protein [Bacteroidales bacterium]
MPASTTKTIVILGAGSIGTALGHILAEKETLKVILLTIEPEVAESINDLNTNQKYFPNIRLSKKLKATLGEYVIRDADILFLAIPSVAIMDYMQQNRKYLNDNTIIVNLAKGFANNNQVIAENLVELLPNRICSMKGPAFARDMIGGSPTGFTLASKQPELWPIFGELFAGTPIYLDYTDDVNGVEILSILKNIYAIVLGIVDAHYNSANLRFLLLTRAFNEMRHVLLYFGGHQETIFRYCGYGDFSLTALNDLSRNRTLGLLIGKGFFTEDISSRVVLEGRMAVNIFYEKLLREGVSDEKVPLMKQLYRVLNHNYPVQEMIRSLLRKEFSDSDD